MKITGTIINYYIHCKRQCYLHYHKLNLEDNSELVQIGKALHEEKNTEELSIESIRIDKLTRDYLVEIKKSDADLEAAKYQLLYYLLVLKGKGIEKKGKLEIIEKIKKDKKTYILELTQETENEINRIIKEIEELVEKEKIPERENTKKCRKCAYYSYCYI